VNEVTNDLDEMTRRATRLADAGAWDDVLDLRDDCRGALERGLQLWPVASYCEYRLALDAPGPWAAQMLTADAGRFALGPMSEVVAAKHAWAELAPHAPAGPVAALAAHERVLRGEDLRDADVPEAAVLEVPLVLAAWEPAYSLAEYKDDEADFPSPALQLPSLDLTAAGDVDDREAADALEAIGSVWATESNGRVDVFAVAPDSLARLTPIAPADAFALVAWAAASGGAHGRRRGMAPGRFAAWWAAAAVAGALEAWPLSADHMGDVVNDRLRWYAWTAAPATGWELRVAVEDTTRNRAYAVVATDIRV
jgi:hypothetical protein